MTEEIPSGCRAWPSSDFERNFEASVDVEAFDSQFDSAYKHAKAGAFAKAAQVVSASKWPRELLLAQKISSGYTLLHQAAWHGQAQAVRDLLRLGADPCIKNKGGQTPADIAEERGNSNALQHLFQAMSMADVWGSVTRQDLEAWQAFYSDDCEALQKALQSGFDASKALPSGASLVEVCAWMNMFMTDEIKARWPEDAQVAEARFESWKANCDKRDDADQDDIAQEGDFIVNCEEIVAGEPGMRAFQCYSISGDDIGMLSPPVSAPLPAWLGQALVQQLGDVTKGCLVLTSSSGELMWKEADNRTAEQQRTMDRNRNRIACCKAAERQGSPLHCALCKAWRFPLHPSWSRSPLLVCDDCVELHRPAKQVKDPVEGDQDSFQWSRYYENVEKNAPRCSVAGVMELHTSESYWGSILTHLIHPDVGYIGH